MDNKVTIKGMFKNYAGLPFSIYILFVARIINRFGGFVHAFLALFLSTYLGMSESEIGTYVLLAGVAGFGGAYIGGKLSDRFSRKTIYLMAQSLAAVLFIPCGFFATRNLEYIPILLIISAFFSSVIRPVSNAMVADIVSKEDRKRAYSLLYLGINVGVALGPMVAAFLLENYLTWFFWGDAVTTFIAVILVAVYVEEKVITDEEMDAISDDDDEAKESGHAFAALLKRPKILIFMLFAVINSMMYAQSGFAFPLLLKDLFGGSEGVAFYAQLIMINAIVVLALTSAIHYLTQQIKPIYNIAMASLFYAVGFGMMSFIEAKSLFVVSIIIWTIGEIQAVTNQNVYLMSLTPINYRGRFGAITSIIFSVGYIGSPKLAGIIIEEKGQPFLWNIMFVMGVVAALGYLLLARIEEKENMVKIE